MEGSPPARTIHLAGEVVEYVTKIERELCCYTIYQVLQRGLYSIDNAYNIPNMRIQGHVCKTNIPSNTAFRGFGGPQGMMIIEHIISEMSAKLNIPDQQVRILDTT